MDSMNGDRHHDADVIVIGGGPAGSTLGTYLALHGYDTVILERTIHPREHVGESLVPSTNRIMEETGFFKRMDEAGFIRKPGGTWTSFRGQVGLEAKIVFAEAPQPGINQDYTYHVDRSRFDSMLLKYADEKGARVVQGASVTRVLFDENERASGVRVRVLNKEFDLTSKFVVDASGRRCQLGNQLGLREKDPTFNQFAIYSWFKGVRPPTDDTGDYIHIHFLPVERGWVWQIPITSEITSVGVVVEKDEFNQDRKTHEEFFNDLLSKSQNTSYIMKEATRTRDFFIEGDYSYKMEKFAGPGWMLIGDAARFVDPIFSSGVSVAMNSARFAFHTIDECMKGANETERLAAYDETVKSGVQIWYEWIKIYYKLQHLFTFLARDPKYRRQMQQLLQGEVFDRSAVEVLDLMREAVKEIEASEDHLLKQYVSQTISID
jgi:1H-pyrrole-2-carbonyl-[peptidyl-carrier protein] chlorinase